MRSNFFCKSKNTLLAAASLALAAQAFPALSIVPINDKITAEKGFSGKFGIALNGQSGNKDEQEYGVDGLLRYRKEQNLFVLIGDFAYSETNDLVDEDELFLHGRWISINQFSPGIDSEVFVQHQYDDFADISSRDLVGANVRWRSEIENDKQDSQLIFATGVFFETETSESTGIQDDTVRANFYGRYVYENKSEYPFVMSLSTYIQPAVNDVSDLRVLALAAVDYPIRPNLSVGFELEVKHNSDPFVDVEKTDVEYGVSLNYAF